MDSKNKQQAQRTTQSMTPQQKQHAGAPSYHPPKTTERIQRGVEYKIQNNTFFGININTEYFLNTL